MARPNRHNVKKEKIKDLRLTSRRLVAYLRRQMPIFVIALMVTIISTTMMIIGPDNIRKLTDEIQKAAPMMVGGQVVVGQIDFSLITNIALFLVIIYLISATLHFTSNFLLATLTARTTYRMRSDIGSKINRLPLSYFDKTSQGDIISRMTNDIDIVGQTMNQSLNTFVRSVTMLIGSTIMMFYTNWIMALTAIVSTLLGFMGMALIIGVSQKHFRIQQEKLGEINGHIEEVYSGHLVVKTSNAHRITKSKFDEINQAMFASGWKSQFISGIMMPLMMFVGNFGYVAICIVGAILVFDGAITIGVITAFMIYVRLFTNPLSELAQVANYGQQAMAALERVFEFLNLEELSAEQPQNTLSAVRGEVEFRHVRFGYTPEKVIIKDLSARVGVGQKVAIVGPTGAGKTTIVNLLMRFYEIDEGEILIDGIDTKSLSRENVHEQFCMVLQDTWIFEGTIMENIVYSKEGVSAEQVVAACKATGLHHFIMTLPGGYQTMLDDKSTLSAGQKQQLTIARAMIQNAPLLILDEATSSVDTRTELIIQGAMDELMRGRTAFVIAHRLSTIKNADLILVMKDGDIVEKGDHQQLLALNGFYATLYNSQFESV